jgi:hypothetical protein
MTIKQLEIRDRGTTMPMLAISVSGGDGWLLRRAGFGITPLVILIALSKMECQYDPYSWSTRARTVPEAHRYITAHWTEIQDNDVIDVEFILGERATKKASERELEAARS